MGNMLPWTSRVGLWKAFVTVCYKMHGWKDVLKTLDTNGNCQRPVFSLGVSQHMHKITNLWKFELNRSTKLGDNIERKNTLVTRSCAFRFAIYGSQFFDSHKWLTVLVPKVKGKPRNSEANLWASMYSTFETSFQPHAFYNKWLQTLFICEGNEFL